MRSALLALLMIIGADICAQDPFYSNYNFGYSILNPALTGSAGMLRAETGYRLQWPKLAGNYRTFNVSSDIWTRAGGIGVNYMYDNAGGLLETSRYELNYAYGFQLFKDTTGRGKLVIQPGVQFTYYSKTIDFNKLTFGSMIDPQVGFTNDPLDAPQGTRARSNIDFSTGLLAYTKRFSAGFAVFHITQPDEGFLGLSKLPMRFVYHFSGIIGNVDPDEQGALRIVPSVLYMKQQTTEQLVCQINAHYRLASLGIGWRNHDALLFIAGYTFSHFTLAYSYDLTISDLAGYTGGAHEFHLRFTFLEDKWKNSRTDMRMFN